MFLISFDPSKNLSLGVNLNLSMPRLNEKLFLQIQGIYTKYSFFDTYTTPQRVTDTHVNANVIQFGVGVKYEYPKGKLRPTLAVGAVLVYLPDGLIKADSGTFYYDGSVRPSSEEKDFPSKFMYGFEIIPGLHYYLTNKHIVFLQLQYLRSFRKPIVNYPANVIQSFGLQTGIYF